MTTISLRTARKINRIEHTGNIEIGGVVAFISGIGRLNDPWGDLVNYFRDVNVTQIKYRLLADAVDQL